MGENPWGQFASAVSEKAHGADYVGEHKGQYAPMAGAFRNSGEGIKGTSQPAGL